MIGYYIRLALQSFRRHPGLTAVMVCAIALGIGVCIVTMTVYHAVSGNPIWWKNDRLYAVLINGPNATRSTRRTLFFRSRSCPTAMRSRFTPQRYLSGA